MGPSAGGGSWIERVSLSRSWLHSIAPDARAFKTALAVGLAWWLGMLLGNGRPIFAAFGALVGLQATVDQSLRRVAVRLAGMFGGLVLAFVVVHFFGANAFGLGFAVLLGLWLGRRVGGSEQVGLELGVMGLLLIGLASGDPGFAIERIWETVLGAAVALAINSFIFSPDYLDEVADSLGELVAVTADGLRQAARAFVGPPTAQDDGVADEAQQRPRAGRASLPKLKARLELAPLGPTSPPEARYRDAPGTTLVLSARIAPSG